eukprot:gb/GEZN01001275.1/.p1 GENE.gb/GEZN01001275.1/~~gb/GEZN01001275.1/.p1  ORF type:complete len:977 (-),score=193.64 gb/GEZN01001275.1/:142-3072(-)
MRGTSSDDNLGQAQGRDPAFRVISTRRKTQRSENVVFFDEESASSREFLPQGWALSRDHAIGFIPFPKPTIPCATDKLKQEEETDVDLGKSSDKVAQTTGTTDESPSSSASAVIMTLGPREGGVALSGPPSPTDSHSNESIAFSITKSSSLSSAELKLKRALSKDTEEFTSPLPTEATSWNSNSASSGGGALAIRIPVNTRSPPLDAITNATTIRTATAAVGAVPTARPHLGSFTTETTVILRNTVMDIKGGRNESSDGKEDHLNYGSDHGHEVNEVSETQYGQNWQQQQQQLQQQQQQQLQQQEQRQQQETTQHQQYQQQQLQQQQQTQQEQQRQLQQQPQQPPQQHQQRYQQQPQQQQQGQQKQQYKQQQHQQLQEQYQQQQLQQQRQQQRQQQQEQQQHLQQYHQQHQLVQKRQQQQHMQQQRQQQQHFEQQQRQSQQQQLEQAPDSLNQERSRRPRGFAHQIFTTHGSSAAPNPGQYVQPDQSMPPPPPGPGYPSFDQVTPQLAPQLLRSFGQQVMDSRSAYHQPPSGTGLPVAMDGAELAWVLTRDQSFGSDHSPSHTHSELEPIQSSSMDQDPVLNAAKISSPQSSMDQIQLLNAHQFYLLRDESIDAIGIHAMSHFGSDPTPPPTPYPYQPMSENTQGVYSSNQSCWPDLQSVQAQGDFSNTQQQSYPQRERTLPYDLGAMRIVSIDHEAEPQPTMVTADYSTAQSVSRPPFFQDSSSYGVLNFPDTSGELLSQVPSPNSYEGSGGFHVAPRGRPTRRSSSSQLGDRAPNEHKQAAGRERAPRPERVERIPPKLFVSALFPDIPLLKDLRDKFVRVADERVGSWMKIAANNVEPSDCKRAPSDAIMLRCGGWLQYQRELLQDDNVVATLIARFYDFGLRLFETAIWKDSGKQCGSCRVTFLHSSTTAALLEAFHHGWILKNTPLLTPVRDRDLQQDRSLLWTIRFINPSVYAQLRLAEQEPFVPPPDQE